MMKKLLMISLILLCGMVTCTPLANGEPGDVLSGKNYAIWQIATYTNGTYPDGIIADLLENMGSLPTAYLANADIQEWVGWLRITLIQAFPGKIFPKDVYNAIVYTIDEYQYGTPKIADAHAAPTCTAGSLEITCTEDPTGADREPVLWRLVSGEYIEQDPTASGYTVSLADGTWTIAPLPAVGNLLVAWNDNFQSFPTMKLTVLP